jgi:hypothetical protein
MATIPSDPSRRRINEQVDKKVNLVRDGMVRDRCTADLDQLFAKNRDGMVAPGRDGGTR